MSQNNVPHDTCPTCKKAWLSNHTLKSVSPEGKISIHCHDEIVEKTDFVLKYVLDARAAKLAAQTALVEKEKTHVSDMQRSRAELKLEFEASVKSAAAQKAAEDIVEIEADHKKALEEGEKTRVQLTSSYDAKVNDLQALLAEVRGDKKTLQQEKSEIAAKLTDCEQKAFDLQLQVGELTASLTDLKARHKGLKDRSLDMVRTLISMGTRVAVLEQKTGVVPKVDPERIFKIVMGEDYDDGEIPVDDLRNDPTPVPTPAPKADIAAVLVAVPQPEPAPAPPVGMVVLDDPTPKSESFASLNDEGDGHNHDVDDGDGVAQQEDASDEDDDESSEEDPTVCSVCDQPSTEEMSFDLKDGSKKRWFACDPSKHADIFLYHMKDQAKRVPKNAMDVITLFNPIQ